MLNSIAGFVGLIAGILAYYAWRIEPFNLTVRKRIFAVEGLDPAAAPITILHFSDLHMRAGETRKAGMLARLQELRPDLVFITGDFVQTTADAPFCAESLRGFQPRYGMIGVLGNHDHFRYGRLSVIRRTKSSPTMRALIANNPQVIRRTLEAAGVKILVNSHKRLDVHGQEIWVIGIDDPYHRLDDLPAALEGVPPQAAKILLAHSPDIIEEASRSGVGLILSGHTHGGQVRLPLLGALVTRTRKPLERPSGVINRNGTLTHISRGIGGGTLTLRFLCPPEATLIELRPAGEQREEKGKRKKG